MRAPEFWRRDGVPARLLTPLGQLFGLAGRLRRRWAAPRRSPVPMICIGNLTVGGAGKTPVALALAEHLLDRARRPHFVTRGYRGREPGPLRVDPARHDCAAVGDEALLLAAVAPTWVARDRLAGARAAARAGAGLVILDDGFQNPWLAPEVGLLVIDGDYGFGNRRLLPAGPLREPVGDGVGRATAVIRVGADRAGIERLLPPHVPCIAAELEPAPGAPAVGGRRVLAFAGIARPDKLFALLRGLGAELVGCEAFADHHPYRRTQVERLLRRAVREDALCVTTSKDAVRLPADLRARVVVFPVAVTWREPAALDRVLDPALVAAEHPVIR